MRLLLNIILICFIIMFIYSSWKFLLILMGIVFVVLFSFKLFNQYSKTENSKQEFSNKEKLQDQQNNTPVPAKKNIYKI